MADQTGPILSSALVILAAMIGVAMMVFHYSRAGALLERWAAENGFRILERQWRPMRRGPFFFTTGRGQEVYRVTVEDREGNIRRGYLRCGGYFLGMFSGNVEVRWDREPPRRPGFPVIFPHDRSEG